jgi:DNA topoisomerase VI subunit B
MTAPAHTLHRETFSTSRLLDFCSEREVVKQIGHATDQWPFVVLKELADNAIDAAEEAEVAPTITVEVTDKPATIVITDNGPGIPPDTVASILDFSVRVSSREAYASPTRGAQGNALKTILAMGFALDGAKGETLIESQAVAHRITFKVDHIRHEPKVDHTQETSNVKNGTRITVWWPVWLRDAKSHFLQMAEDFGWLNPHLALSVTWNGEHCSTFKASDPAWAKWKPTDPTSPHWYDVARLRRLMGAYIAHDQDRGREPRTVREFISEFRGLSGTGKQKIVLDEVGATRLSLPAFFGSGDRVNGHGIAGLLAAMKQQSRPVKPINLGLIGRDHLAARFKAAGADLRTFKYRRTTGESEGLPDVIEAAFAYCPNGSKARRIITGVNWSVAISNPFRRLGMLGQSLDTVLATQRSGRDEPIVFLLHLARPRIAFTDHGKTTLAIPDVDETSDGEEVDDE